MCRVGSRAVITKRYIYRVCVRRRGATVYGIVLGLRAVEVLRLATINMHGDSWTPTRRSSPFLQAHQPQYPAVTR
jgi:hypothetical protein